MTAMQMIPHLDFDGQCEAAFHCYKQCFAGEISFMATYGSQTAIPYSPELKDKVFHATLNIGGQKLTGVDVKHSDYRTPHGFALQLNLDDANEAQRIFDVLSEGGSVLVPLQQTSWAGHYAMLVDRFGIPWEVNCPA